MPKPSKVTGLGPDVRLDDAGRRVLLGRLADVRQYEKKLLFAMDPDDVHDMRVAIRRLRAALALFGAPKALRRKVKRFQDGLGAVRDLHVQIEWLEHTSDGASREIIRVVAIVEAHLKQQMPDRITRLREELWRWTTSVAPYVRREAHHVEHTQRLGGGRSRRRLREHMSRVGEGIGLLMTSPDPEHAHRLRIDAKKLRYLAEILEPAWPEKIGVLLDMLQPLQESLGNLHDADVRVAQLTALAAFLPQSGDGVRRLLAQATSERQTLEKSTLVLVRRWSRERVVPSMRRLLVPAARAD